MWRARRVPSGSDSVAVSDRSVLILGGGCRGRDIGIDGLALPKRILRRQAILHFFLKGQFLCLTDGGGAFAAVVFCSAAEARLAIRVDLLHQLAKAARASLPSWVRQILTLDICQIPGFGAGPRLSGCSTLQLSLVHIFPGWLARRKMRDTVLVHPLVHLGGLGRRHSEQGRKNEYCESSHGKNARADRRPVA